MNPSRPAIKLPPRAASHDDAPATPESDALPLPHVGIFAGLSVQSLKNLTVYGSYQPYATGAEIVREGAAMDRLYVIVKGRVALTAKRGARQMPVSEAHAGECLGEVNLLEPGPSTATIRATEDAVLWSLDITGLRIFISDHSGGAGALLMGMASCLSLRLREANARICQHHVLPVETLPPGRARAITASNAPIAPGFFDRIKKSLAGSDRKVRISTKIKM